MILALEFSHYFSVTFWERHTNPTLPIAIDFYRHHYNLNTFGFGVQYLNSQIPGPESSPRTTDTLVTHRDNKEQTAFKKKKDKLNDNITNNVFKARISFFFQLTIPPEVRSLSGFFTLFIWSHFEGGSPLRSCDGRIVYVHSTPQKGLKADILPRYRLL
jgi:hypothetical protein